MVQVSECVPDCSGGGLWDKGRHSLELGKEHLMPETRSRRSYPILGFELLEDTLPALSPAVGVGARRERYRHRHLPDRAFHVHRAIELGHRDAWDLIAVKGDRREDHDAPGPSFLVLVESIAHGFLESLELRGVDWPPIAHLLLAEVGEAVELASPTTGSHSEFGERERRIGALFGWRLSGTSPVSSGEIRTTRPRLEPSRWQRRLAARSIWSPQRPRTRSPWLNFSTFFRTRLESGNCHHWTSPSNQACLFGADTSG
jgi:hypothetical protein